MAHTGILEDVASLFIETSESHHKAFLQTEGVDSEWPLWYADYLHDQLGELLHTELTKSEIVYLLLMLEKKRTVEASGSKWPKYYARILIDMYK